MSDQEDIARGLAKGITDKLFREALPQHAEEWERSAEELEARLATLKEASQPADSMENIAALKPSSGKPDREG